MEALIEAVQASAPDDAPVIIAGDFNDWNDNVSDALRSRLGVNEVFDEERTPFGVTSMLRHFGMRRPRLKPARTFPAAMPWLRLDRIYVRGFKVESAEVLYGASWARLSDHAPIVATLRIT